MTDQEYQAMKAEIIAKFGQPEYDMRDPVNESARLIAKLVARKSVEDRAATKKQKSEFAQLVGSLDKTAETLPAPDINDNDLTAFDETERQLITAYFSDLNQSPKTLATRFNVNYQMITALFKSDRFKILYKKVFDSILPLEGLIALRALLKKGDTKAVLETLRHYGLIKTEAVDVNITRSTPIEDVAAVDLLKKIGDSIVKRPN
jgi:hypothetical protein